MLKVLDEDRREGLARKPTGERLQGELQQNGGRKSAGAANLLYADGGEGPDRAAAAGK
jgi:hypothetical protein